MSTRTEGPFNPFLAVLDEPQKWAAFENDWDLRLGFGRKSFLWGVSTSTFQDSGSFSCPFSQWCSWEKKILTVPDYSGKGCGLYDLMRQDPGQIVTRLNSLGINSFRFSIEWSLIEPEQGSFKEEALQPYIELCLALQQASIEPVVTLHHFSEPCWFHEKGSFMVAENGLCFIRFALKVIEKLFKPHRGRSLARYFLTLNEPAIEALCRYCLGLFSPGHYLRIGQAKLFLSHMLQAHCHIYQVCKADPLLADQIKIGFTHQYLHFIPKNRVVNPICRHLNLLQEATFSFFKQKESEKQTKLLDFIGLQYYSRVFLGLSGIQKLGRPSTAMKGLQEDPEGLFEAIIKLYQVFKAPILITENGIATDCERQRARYLRRALIAADCAEQVIGKDMLLGYMCWSFCDNFEWLYGWKPQFGLYGLTEQRLLQKEYKEGALPLIEAIMQWQLS